MRFPDSVAPTEILPLPEPPKVDDDAAAEMAALGMTFNDVVKGYRAHIEQQALFDSDVKTAAHFEDTKAAILRTAAPPAITGYHDAVMASRKDADDAYLASIPDSHRETYARDWQATRKNLSDIMAKAEYQARGQYEAGAINDAVDRSCAIVAAAPANTDTLLSALSRHIDNASSIEGDAKTTLKADAEIKLRTAQLVALHGKDPVEMRRQLGLPDPLTVARQNAAAAEPVRPSAAVADPLATARQNTDAAEAAVGVPTAVTGVEAPAANPAVAASSPQSLVSPQNFVGSPSNTTPTTATPSTATPSASSNAANAIATSDNSSGNIAANDDVRTAAESGGQAASNSTQRPDVAAAGTTPKGNPYWNAIPPDLRDGLVNDATVRYRIDQTNARVSLEQRLEDIDGDLTATGRTHNPLPTLADFAQAYGPVLGERNYQQFQGLLSLGSKIDTIKTMTPEQQAKMLAADRVASRDDVGSAVPNQLHQAITINQQQRLADPAGYVAKIFNDPGADFSGDDQAELVRSIATQKLHQDQLGIPLSAQRLLPVDVAQRTADIFNAQKLPTEQRVAPILELIAAIKDPTRRQILMNQLVQFGVPDTVQSAMRAFNRPSDPNALRSGTRLVIAALDQLGSLDRDKQDDNPRFQAISPKVAVAIALDDLGIPLAIYGVRKIPANTDTREARLRSDPNFRDLDRDMRLLEALTKSQTTGSTDVLQAARDAVTTLYGRTKRIRDSYLYGLVNIDEDEQALKDGTYGLLPEVDVLERKLIENYPEIYNSGESKLYPKEGVNAGFFRNAPSADYLNNYVFIDGVTHSPLTDPGGNPFIFSRAQMLQAGERAANRVVNVPGPGGLDVPMLQLDALRGKYQTEAKKNAWKLLLGITAVPLLPTGVGEEELAAAGIADVAAEIVEQGAGDAIVADAGETIAGSTLRESAAEADEAAIAEAQGAANEARNGGSSATTELESGAAKGRPLEPKSEEELLRQQVQRNAEAGNLGRKIHVAILNKENVWIKTENGLVAIVKIGGGGKLKGANGKVWDLFEIADSSDGSTSPLVFKEMPEAVDTIPAEFPEGSFSTVSRADYPIEAQPSGKISIISKEERALQRVEADRINKATSKRLGLGGKGVDIHEINPIKFGGSATDLENKVVLPRELHKEVTKWWNTIQRDLESKK